MGMKRAHEIMLALEEFPYIPYWFTLRQALAEMEEPESNQESGRHTPWLILVFNAQNQFLGMVQRQDILRGLNPRLREKAHPLAPSSSSPGADPELIRLGFSEGKVVQMLKEYLSRPMAEFIVPPLLTAEVDDPILLVTHLMIDHGLTFVPVTRSGEIVGLIYLEDALNEVMAFIE